MKSKLPRIVNKPKVSRLVTLSELTVGRFEGGTPLLKRHPYHVIVPSADLDVRPFISPNGPTKMLLIWGGERALVAMFAGDKYPDLAKTISGAAKGTMFVVKVTYVGELDFTRHFALRGCRPALMASRSAPRTDVRKKPKVGLATRGAAKTDRALQVVAGRWTNRTKGAKI